MEPREHLLLRLVHFERPLSPILRELGKYGWDSDHELVRVSGADLEKVIRMFLSGGASSVEIEEWANALEGREDVGSSAEVKQAIYELANPMLEGPLTNENASTLIKKLQKSGNAS